MDPVSIIMIYVIGGLFAGMFSAMFMDLCLNCLPQPFEDYGSWQRARTARVKADPENFAHYKRLCELEKRYARDAIFSIGWVVSVLFWPVALPLTIAFVISVAVLKFFRLLRSLGSLFESAKGV